MPSPIIERMSLSADLAAQLPRATIADPFQILGLHEIAGQWWVRVYRPGALGVVVHPEQGRPFHLAPREVDGLFEAMVDEGPFRYELEIRFHDLQVQQRDPYSFWLLCDEWDLARFNEGRHHNIEDVLGAQPCHVDGCEGVRFAVWAPNAQRVSVVGDFNLWNGCVYGMRPRMPFGIWEIFIPDVPSGSVYKYEVKQADGTVVLKADPFARQAEVPPATASVVPAQEPYQWGDHRWLETRASHGGDWSRRPMAIYECHLGSWKRGADDQLLGYREIATELAEYVQRLGYTHVEFMPVASHPFPGSWGYQILGQFAASAFYGTPDDLRYLVDILHQHDIGVIIDFVPAHFPKDIWGLAQYDGTPCFEYNDPREGEHRDWDTLIYNYRRPEVRNFLLGAALFWLRHYHIDGIRVDAVSSMLYRNYSREEGEWIPNAAGGNANEEAVSFLQELNALTHMLFPGVLSIAEESTAWQGVTAPTDWEGLGFDLKWNMGWMHDTLRFLSQDPVMRPGSHEWITFHQWYAYDERWVLPLSHDEMVHGKGSLLDKMFGDYGQRLAQLRMLLGYQIAIPGRPLLFQGGEFGQGSEWNYLESLNWDEAEQAQRQGVQAFLAAALQCYRNEAALHELDDQRQGFCWVDVENRAESILAFRRSAHEAPDVLVACNFTPIDRHDYPLCVPQEGEWELILDSTYLGGDQAAAERYNTAIKQPDGRAMLRVGLPGFGIRFWRAPQ